MVPDLTLLAVLVSLHLIEGLQRLPEGAWVFRRRLWGGWTAQPASAFPKLGRLRTALGGLLPSQICLPLQGPPWMADATGMAQAHLDPAKDATGARVWIPWAALEHLQIDGSELKLGPVILVRALDPVTAKQWKNALQKTAAAPLEARVPMLAELEGAMLDARRATRTWRRFWIATRPLQVASWLQAGLLFLVLPALLVSGWLAVLWPVFVPVLLMNQVAVVIGYLAAERRINPGQPSPSRAPLASMFLSPPWLVRAPEILALHAFRGFHPLAVAAALGQPDLLAQVAGACMRPLCHPVTEEEPLPQGFETAAREARRRLLESWFEAHGVHPDTWLAPPPRSASAEAYCPRCHAPYVRTDGACADCPGVPLQRWPAPSVPGCGHASSHGDGQG